jgi:hypothetical protein
MIYCRRGIRKLDRINAQRPAPCGCHTSGAGRCYFHTSKPWTAVPPSRRTPWAIGVAWAGSCAAHDKSVVAHNCKRRSGSVRQNRRRSPFFKGGLRTQALTIRHTTEAT